MPDRSLYPKKRGRAVGPSDIIAAKLRKKTGNTQSPLNSPPPFGVQRQRIPMANSNLPAKKGANPQRQAMRARFIQQLASKKKRRV